MKTSRFSLFILSLVLPLIILTSYSNTAAAEQTFPVACTAGAGDVASLKQAILDANANSGMDTIVLGEDCIYTLSAVDNTDAFGGPNGLPVITEDVRFEGQNATIQRDPTAADFRLIYVASGASIWLEEITLANGRISNGSGGAIKTQMGAVNLFKASFLNNHASGVGGAVSTMDFYANASHFEDNSATANGGAVMVGGLSSGHFGADDTAFINNTALGWGGAVTALVDSIVTDSHFENNRSGTGEGGAIFVDAKLHFVYTTFLNNHSDQNGGAVSAFGPLSMVDSIFRGNRSEKNGGALYNYTTVQTNATIFEENQAGSVGGAIYTNGYNGGLHSLTDSSFINNQS
ncbi:MAG: hypothetical protein KDE51_19025 [Anaerolineales bacterium]|nr:hypothetical protein [Anaerolineales bacterium]